MKTIGVIGYTGIVGSSIYKWFKKQGHCVMGISASKQTCSWDSLNKSAEYIFIAVPTPYNWNKKEIDLSILEDVIKKIESNKKEIAPIVVIKSTIPPGTTKKIQKSRKDLKIIFSPEFLSTNTAWEDFINPDRQIVGYTNESYNHVQEVLNLLPQSPYDVIMKASEAETVKYINNFHGALMVIFSNFFYDICEKLDINYKIVKKASIASKWVGSPMGRMYWNIFHKGKRGYGGKCFPKDVSILIDWCKENKIDTEIIEATKKANIRILKEQGLTEIQVERKK